MIFPSLYEFQELTDRPPDWVRQPQQSIPREVWDQIQPGDVVRMNYYYGDGVDSSLLVVAWENGLTQGFCLNDSEPLHEERLAADWTEGLAVVSSAAVRDHARGLDWTPERWNLYYDNIGAVTFANIYRDMEIGPDPGV